MIAEWNNGHLLLHTTHEQYVSKLQELVDLLEDTIACAHELHGADAHITRQLHVHLKVKRDQLLSAYRVRDEHDLRGLVMMAQRGDLK